jgi:hypothetical protein
MITNDNGLNEYQVMYYDNGSEYNVKGMDTVVINTKYGTLYVLTELNHLVLMRILEKQSK